MKKAKAAQGKVDFVILILTIVLVMLGLVIVASASYYKATVEMGDSLHYLKRQAFGAIVGLGTMIVLSRSKFTRFEKYRYLILAGSFLMLIAVYLPGIGMSVHDSSRWLNLGIVSVQPAEIAKFALIVFMSSYMDKNREKMPQFIRGVLPMLAVVGVFCLMILLQPNFSMVVCIVMLTACMLYAGGARAKHLVILGVTGVAAALVLIFTEPYRAARMFAFLDPWADPLDTGYQLVQSFFAIASGGFFGRGLGMSQQKLMYLPFSESDFIFSVWAEEMGFLGVVVLLLLYGLLVWRGIRVALTCTSRFGGLVAAGISSLMAIQVLINVAVVTGSIPPTGQPLPFISFGSTSLVIFMGAMGVLLNISRYCTKS